MEIIGVVNQKGGVAKTFTSVNLGIGLAKKGLKVLLIDLDPQGSLSISLGLKAPDEEAITIAEMLEAVRDGREFDHTAAVHKHEEGVDFVPSNIALLNTEMSLINAICREHVLGKYLDRFEDTYDVAIIDCSPTLGLTTVNALACVNKVIIPIQAQYLSIKGMEQLLASVLEIKKMLNRSLEISGILVTMANTRTKEYKETCEKLHDKYGDQARIFKSVVPYSTKAMETTKHGVSIFKHDPHGKVAEAYQNLVNELLGSSEKG